MTQDYLSRGIQSLSARLGLTKLVHHVTDPVVNAVNANADILDSAAIIVTAPASATATGEAGQIGFDGTHFYLCVAKNRWLRASLETF